MQKGSRAHLHVEHADAVDSRIEAAGFIHEPSIYIFWNDNSASQVLGRHEREMNMVICHLGAGASMACIRGGQSIDTSMGLTPLEG